MLFDSKMPPLTIATEFGPVAVSFESDQLARYSWGEPSEAIPFQMLYLQLKFELGETLAASTIAEAEYWARQELSSVEQWLERAGEYGE